MKPVRLVVTGATGKVGREVVRAVVKDPAFLLVGAVARRQAGADVGEALGLEGGRLGVPLLATLGDVLAAGVSADVVVDFTNAHVAREVLPVAIAAGIAPVVGTTGLTREELEQYAAQCRRRELGGAFIANFAVGAVLMMRFAQEARRFFPHAEIIELHAHTKLDAPSGTAVRTKHLLESSTGDLGGPEVPVHSVRLPGLVAHQEVIFGGPGQYLTIRHDTTSRESFVPGVLLSCKWVLQHPGQVTLDLEEVTRG